LEKEREAKAADAVAKGDAAAEVAGKAGKAGRLNTEHQRQIKHGTRCKIRRTG
jgi:hypothetical protein